ncbi:PREDICTED: fasciclin-like arabinogalactan protein 21 [Ipomoea nil]|uniref:fasciclin-like arabinogalactan protein 21 n=1 Tax=Ipomoea nil TaxID=35883 RepID=UPI0009012573|nr:PREDICTED: fasciclin-like arabinogalactan protein 21 [Ipomoea nil]
MATALQVEEIILLLLLVFRFTSATTLTTATTASVSGLPPSFPPPVVQSPNRTDEAYTPPLVATVLFTLGFHELSTAAVSANISATSPITIFAPADSSLATCPTCSLSLLLQEHSVPGLYPLHFLRKLASATKIPTLAKNRCLTVTTTVGVARDQDPGKVFVNGAEIVQPDIFHNSVMVIHGVEGFLTHLSTKSCNMEEMTTMSFPPQPLGSTTGTMMISIMRLMQNDAILRLESIGYRIVALAMKVKYAEISKLKTMTVFAIDDANLLAGNGLLYLSNFHFHVVPNKRILAPELVSLPAKTVLPTMDGEHKLVVTTTGGGGALSPLRINYVKITSLNLLHNSRIVVHQVSAPFPHMIDQTAQDSILHTDKSQCDFNSTDGTCNIDHAVNAPLFPADSERHYGL